MREIEFYKFHGFGNDYVIFEKGALTNIASLKDFTVRVCDRHRGIGGDGVVIIEEPITDELANYGCTILNPDGSEAAFSGNGTRCAVAYIYLKRLWKKNILRLETASGTKTFKLLKREENHFWFEAEIGQPSRIQKLELSLSMGKFSADFLDVGNPVCVFFVDDFDSIDWRKIGAETEVYPIFPRRTNAVFVKVISSNEIEVRIWERGAGETSSSGTCSVAATVVHLARANKRGKVSVRAIGGITETMWDKKDKMHIKGEAEFVFYGKLAASISECFFRR
jgi:diaminopimelate epimerase